MIMHNKVDSNTHCRCNCGYTCGRKCGLPISECMKKHYSHDCDHRFDGPNVEVPVMGGMAESSTCSICGMAAIVHDLHYGI